MSRSLLAILVLASFLFSPASVANGGASTPLCPDRSAPDCVQSNWGQTGPDGVDTGLAPLKGDPTASTASSGRLAMKILPVAAKTRPQASDSPLNTVLSPINLFPKETAALTSAIKQARFNADGSIASGQERIASAAAAAARAAGTRYTLTLYIKVPQKLAPDDGDLLGKKVQSINEVLSNSAGGATGKPRT